MIAWILLLGACEAPTFGCGKLICDAGQVCVHDSTEDPEEPFDEPWCEDPPASCGGDAACDCLACDECREDDGVHCTVDVPDR